MKKVLLLALVGAACLFADSTNAKEEFVVEPEVKKVVVEEKLEIKPVIKAEAIFIQEVDKDAKAGAIILGDNDIGVIATKGDVEVAGVVSIVDTSADGYGVVANKVYIKKGLGENFSLTTGYKDLPFGHWTSNCVNFPLVRYLGVSKVKAPQLSIGFEKGIIRSEVAGFASNFETKSVAAKVEADLTVVRPNISVKSVNFDTTTIALGAEVDLGKIGINTSYVHGFNDDLVAGYFEVSAFPNDFLIPSLRAGIVGYNNDFADDITQFSVFLLYLVTDNVYAGIEYTALVPIVDKALEDPTHSITALIGCEF